MPRDERNVISESTANGETSQFLAKQEILWKGFLSMFTVSKFVTKAYLVSGSAEILKSELPDTLEIGGRIMPQTVWDYIAKLKTNITKELCVIRFHPSSEEEEVAYVSLFSYFSSRGRFGVVSNHSRSIKDVYLVPLSAKESIPSILQPLEGPGFEKNRPNLLLGLAIIQKTKRPGSTLQEMEEKKSKVPSKDPLWIPKPPVLYGSDKLEVFKPYDPETPASTTPPLSPPCPESPSESSSSAKIIPSHLTSMKSNSEVSTSSPPASNPSTSSSISESNMKTPSVTPLSTILNALFKNKQTNVMVSNEEKCTTNVTTDSEKVSVIPHVSRSMMDPIVQQYGQKSKVKDLEEDDTFDRPYDPEEEYDPAIGYETFSSQSKGKNLKSPPLSSTVDDDVAYDPEDETIFQDVQLTTHVDTPSFSKSSIQASPLAAVPQTLPTGTVVVSAATLTEQQRMLEELNKQIEEQKRQLKEQEEALRQQKEAVGIFMAQFSSNDPMMSLPPKPLPLSQVFPNQSGVKHSEPPESKNPDPEETSNPTDGVDAPDRLSQTVKQEAEGIGHHQRDEVIVKETAAEVLQGDPSSGLFHVPGDIEEEIDTEKVKKTGQHTEVETTLNGRLVTINHAV
nr:death-inducer obliterator 1-like [Nerophis lumbriciformis]